MNRVLRGPSPELFLHGHKQWPVVVLFFESKIKIIVLSAPKTSLDTTGQTTADLLSTYSDDEYIKKIQKRLKEDAFAREQREKRRRRLLMDQLIAHEAQEVRYLDVGEMTVLGTSPNATF